MMRDERLIDGGELADLIDASRNTDVVAYLDRLRPSCHSDTGDALIRSAERCGAWVAFSPSFQQYRYVALVTDRLVFALGLGSSSIVYRLPPPMHAIALATGGVEASEIGSDEGNIIELQ